MRTQSRNCLNVFVVGTILIIILGCACPTDRNRQGLNDSDEPKRDANTAEKRKVSNDNDPNKKPDNGDFIVRHGTVKNAKYASLDKSLKDNKVLEKAADRLNRSLALPNDITLRTKDCGQVNAFYDPRDRSITFCYELMEHFFRLYKSTGATNEKANEQMNKAITFVFLHELGHAVIDAYELPITANEEDAADRCSSYICIEELGEDGVQAILAAADAFNIEAKGRTPSKRSLADEHLLQEQRFFNSLCMVYGSNPAKYDYIVSKGYLPKPRAVRCPSEYEKTARAWVKLLEPWRKD